MQLNKALIIIAAAVLAALNVGSLSISGLVVAVVLVIVVLTFLRGKTMRDHGIYAFLIAELSPLGLQPYAWVAFTYQTFSLLLLAAMLLSFESLRPLDEYRSSLPKIIVAASVFLGLNGVVLYAKPLGASGPQLFGLMTVGAIGILSVMLLIEHYDIRLPQFKILGSKL